MIRRSSASRAFAPAIAAMLAACVPGSDDAGYAPPGPPPPRPDSLPSAYASVAAFCASPEKPTAEPAPTSDDARPVPRGPDDRVPNMKDVRLPVQMRCIVRDQAQLRQLWKLTLHPETPPEVDFGEQMLVVAASGERGSSGYAISINDVWQRGDSAIVTVGEYLTGHGCMGSAEVINPADAVRIPRVAAVRFHETIQSGDTCL